MSRRRLGFWRRLAVMLLKPPLWLLTARNWRGMEHLPPTGGVIVVANHISYADPLVVAHYVYDAGRWPQFLAKQGVFDVPVAGRILHKLRQIPVRRGTVDAARSLESATAAVIAGDAIVIYPEGTITRQPQLWPMRGRTGVARLWLATGAPVIPVVNWGAQQLIDPHTRKLRPRPRTPVTVAAGPPVDLSAFQGAPATTATLQGITEQVMLALQELLAEVRQEQPPAREPEPGRDGAR